MSVFVPGTARKSLAGAVAGASPRALNEQTINTAARAALRGKVCERRMTVDHFIGVLTIVSQREILAMQNPAGRLPIQNWRGFSIAEHQKPVTKVAVKRITSIFLPSNVFGKTAGTG